MIRGILLLTIALVTSAMVLGLVVIYCLIAPA